MKFDRKKQIEGYKEQNERYGIRTYLRDNDGNFIKEFTSVADFVDFYFNPNSTGIIDRVDRNNNTIRWVV